MLKFGLLGLVRLEMCFSNVESFFHSKGCHGFMQKIGESWSFSSS
jgi:hypothetical protein